MASATSTTFRYRSSGFRAGFTLVEMMVSLTVGSILIAMVMSAVVVQCRMSAAVGNYEVASRQGRIAMKQFECDIRQAKNLLATPDHANGYDPTRVNMEIVTGVAADGTAIRSTVAYYYNAATRTLYREQPAGSNRRTLINDLSDCRFSYFGRNDNQLPSTGNPSPSPMELRRVLLSAVVTKSNLSQANRDRMVSASVVMRKPLL
jgi:prepilin-type N-terminal cleavage/methylation domain-containing protein